MRMTKEVISTREGCPVDNGKEEQKLESPFHMCLGNFIVDTSCAYTHWGKVSPAPSAFGTSNEQNSKMCWRLGVHKFNDNRTTT